MDANSTTSFSIHGLSRESAYQKIDAEIRNLEKRIHSLQTLRNSVSPISSIPNELLSKVFWLCCGLDECPGLFDNYFDEDGEEFEPSLDLQMRLTVSWVSRHWRHVAHGSSQLWTHIFGQDSNFPADYVEHCYHLSKGPGLVVDLDEPTDEVIEASLSDLGRIRCLAIVKLNRFGDVMPSKTLSGPVWEHPAPVLQALTLWGTSFTNIFSSQFPQLTRLKLFECEFDWDAPLLSCSTLSTLRIDTPFRKIFASRLLRLLQSLPQLMDCNLSTCIESGNGPDSGSPSRIRLPMLQKLTIQDDPHLISRFLRSLDLTKVSITTTFRASPSFTLHQTLSRFQRDIGHQFSDIHSIKILHSRFTTEFIISTPPRTYELQVLGGELRCLEYSCRNFSLENLRLCHTDVLSVDEAVLLGRLPRLNKLRLIRQAAVCSFIDALRDNSENSQSSSSKPSNGPLFPALQELALVNMASPIAYDGLLDVLRDRKAKGIGLKKLLFPKSGLVEQDIVPFIAVVDDVSYDRSPSMYSKQDTEEGSDDTDE